MYLKKMLEAVARVQWKQDSIVKLLFFAWLKQRVGHSESVLAKPADVETVLELVSWLARQSDGYARAFEDISRIRVSINQTHAALSDKISDSDEVAFFPPVTGG